MKLCRRLDGEKVYKLIEHTDGPYVIIWEDMGNPIGIFPASIPSEYMTELVKLMNDSDPTGEKSAPKQNTKTD